MKQPLILSAWLILTPLQPLHATEEPQETPFSQLEQTLRDLMQQLEPRLQDLARGLDALEPDLQRLLSQMQGMVDYDPPVILPNGDILIRRRAPMTEPEQPQPEAPAPDQSPDGSSPMSEPFEL